MNRIWREIMDTGPGLATGAVHWILLQRIAASLTSLGARRVWIEESVATGIALGETGSYS